MSNGIHQLIYISRSDKDMTVQDVNRLVDSARERNKKNNVTGMLLYRGGFFLQYLEGDVFDVSYTFKKIRDDRRHKNVKLILSQNSNERIFPTWSMNYRPEDEYHPLLKDQVVEVFENLEHKNSVDLLKLFHSFMNNR